METTAGVKVLKDKGIKPQIIYIDADHHYARLQGGHPGGSLRAFPDAILVGDDYGHYESVRNAVTECAGRVRLRRRLLDGVASMAWTYHRRTTESKRTGKEFDKHVHVDQNPRDLPPHGVGVAGPSSRSPSDRLASLLAGHATRLPHYLIASAPRRRRDARTQTRGNTTAAASACPARAAACRPCQNQACASSGRSGATSSSGP